jgi:hypothetical protein
MAGAAARFRPVDFIVRWLFVFALMTAIYNPTGYSFIDWLLVKDSDYLPLKVFVGATMVLVLWFVYAMVIRVMKNTGIRVGAVTLVMGAWALDNLGLMPRSATILIVLAQAGVAGWLAVGLSMVLVRAQVAGQIHSVDEH